MANRIYPSKSIMKSLKSRLYFAQDDIRQYLINESIISDTDKDINYQVKVDNKSIRRKQRDIIELKYLINLLKIYHNDNRN